jgi:hypothetical protein
MPLDPNYGRPVRTSRSNGWTQARPTRHLVVLLVLLLAMAALWPLTFAVDWFMGNYPIFQTLSRNDLFGFSLFPQFLLSVRPLLAAAAALSCPWASFLVVTSDPQRAYAILVRTALGLGAAVLAIVLLGPLTSASLAWMLPTFGGIGPTDPPGTVSQIIARQNGAAVSVIVSLLGIAMGFGVIAAISRSAPPPPIESDGASVAADRIFGPPSPGFGEPADEGLRDAPPQPPSAAAKSFNERTYRVRPRPQLLLGLRKLFDDYEIRGISHEHFSYTMTSGVLKRESDGAVIFSVSRRPGALTDTFDVVDSETGLRAGSFRSRGPGWDIDDALGRPVLFVIRDIEEERHMRYVASIGDREVCRYTWSFGPFGLFNVALEVEFSEGGPPFDRALAVALGPFIEEEARLLSAELRGWD